MAFEYFKHENIDIAVIETGMGGRLDSTNLISPLVSVITNISLDHTQFLGETLEGIAIEKAGIIKNNTPVIIGESNIEYNSVFINTAKEKKTSCEFSNEHFQIPYALKNMNQKQCFDVYKNDKKMFEKIELDLLGHYQQKNVLTAINTIEKLKNTLIISKEHIYSGLKNIIKNTRLLGRWQILGNNPQIICDTGHNEAGVKLVLEQIEQTAFEKLHIVWGMVNDKSIDKIMAMLPQNAQYYFTKASIPRALNEQDLYKIAKKYNLKGNMFSSVKKALKTAKLSANQNDLILVGGSTFVVAEVL